MIHFDDALKCSIPLTDGERTILETSLAAGVLHYHQCNGRARCTTCRVRVIEGEEHLSPPDSAEKDVLLRHHLASDVRLACQTYVKGEVTISRVILDPSSLQGNGELVEHAEERPLAVMFCDLRQFTPFAAAHMPQDVIYVLNRYFRDICEPVFSHRGTVNQYLGDGFLALFGLQDMEPSRFCLDAARSAVEILQRLEKFNDWLEGSFGVRFKCGIGLDFGTCVVGKAGHPLQKSFMVLGDSVNRASRIEGQTKFTDSPILASREFTDQVAPFIVPGASRWIQLKGWSGDFELVEFSSLLATDGTTLVKRKFDS
jgi:adenylate cyclase